MRTRKVGRWSSRLVAVAAFGLGAALGGFSTAVAEETVSNDTGATDEATSGTPADQEATMDIDTVVWE
jgi:hypothetical protein